MRPEMLKASCGPRGKWKMYRDGTNADHRIPLLKWGCFIFVCVRVARDPSPTTTTHATQHRRIKLDPQEREKEYSIT